MRVLAPCREPTQQASGPAHLSGRWSLFPESPICPAIGPVGTRSFRRVSRHTPTPLHANIKTGMPTYAYAAGLPKHFLFLLFLTNASDLMLKLMSFLFSLLPNFQRTLFSSTGLQITCQSCKKADSLVPLPVWGSGQGKWEPALRSSEDGSARCALGGRSVPGHSHVQQIWVSVLVFSTETAHSDL